MNKLEMPASVTNQIINGVALGLALILSAICIHYHLNVMITALLTIGVYAGTIIILEIVYLNTPSRPSTGLRKFHSNINYARVVIKLLGLYFTLLLLCLAYWLFPEYYQNMYQPYWRFFKYGLGVIAILAIPYFIFIDPKEKDPLDAYWQVGRMLCFKAKPNYAIAQHFLAWTVKGFFLPLMFVYFIQNLEVMTNGGILLPKNINEAFHVALLLLFTIDVFAAVTGYIFTMRIFDAHIRSTDPTCLGWVVCIVCYQPFNNFLNQFYLTDFVEHTWLQWIQNEYVLLLWFLMILFLLIVYVLATIAFGIRFSNLTHRGIITNGPYRYTKHPAYLCKTLYWWLTCIPFTHIMTDALSTFKLILFLTVLSMIYYLRAKTEEAHLSKDPTYVQYARWIDEHGLFAPVTKRLSFLRSGQAKASEVQ